MNNNFNGALEVAKNIERKMDVYDLHNDITAMALKYSSGTGIQHLSVAEFNTFCNLIEIMFKTPSDFLKNNNERK